MAEQAASAGATPSAYGHAAMPRRSACKRSGQPGASGDAPERLGVPLFFFFLVMTIARLVADCVRGDPALAPRAGVLWRLLTSGFVPRHT